MTRRGTVVAVVLLALGAPGLAGGARQAAAPAQVAAAAALGDSFASGEAAGPYVEGTDTAANRCHRSERAWPRLLGAATTVHLLACSGASIADLATGVSGPPDDVPQLGRLAALAAAGPIDLVTVTIGGNDLGFAGIVRSCVTRPACLGRIDAAQVPRLAALRPRLAGTYRAIGAASGGARLVVVGYPDIFPGPAADSRCAWLSATERARLERLAGLLETGLRGAARDAGAEYVSTRGALAGHELCTRRRSWLHPITPANPFNPQQAHPRPPGQRAIAAAVRARLAPPSAPAPSPVPYPYARS